MTTIRSPSNYTINPLGANNILIGQYDNVLQYATAIITCKGDQDMELTLYQTIDKITVDETTYLIHAGIQEEIIINLKYPFIKSTLRNMTSVDQTYLNYEILYRQSPVAIPLSANVPSNIFDSVGDPISAEGGILKARLYDPSGNMYTNANPLIVGGNLNMYDSYGHQIQAVNNCMQTAIYDGAGISIGSTGNALDVNIKSNTIGLALESSIQTLINQNLNNGGALWNGATGIANNVISDVIDLTQKSSIIYSFFGSCVPDTVDTDSPSILIQYSGDGTTWFPSPNTIGLGVNGGNFAIDVISGAGYVSAVVTGLTTTCAITLILNHI